MMASFGKRLTRFVAAQTIRAVQIRILRVLGKGLCSAHDISDQALWPKLQGKLNREWICRFGNLVAFRCLASR
jgi:hypothetical protein